MKNYKLIYEQMNKNNYLFVKKLYLEMIVDAKKKGNLEFSEKITTNFKEWDKWWKQQ